MERSTRQRSSIRTVMEAAGRPLLPGEILAAAQRDVPNIGLATVYRNLKQLMDAGEIQMVELPGEAPRYELSGHKHHHHFSCKLCHRVFDVHECPGNMMQLAPQGFVVEGHELTLYGRCNDCRSGAASQRPGAAPHVAAPGAGKMR
ncbi:transcriptional repressor [Verminephrobacter eiseniae]|uniref:Fur family transcriptional regulator n=1 Tax=Verminephrobacter eiseniae TaxID=364317 RepID=UPI00223872DF|nr:transcriptional repressor [Verminephrobacter eiseniae]MCW5259610.1 transcriptional repressor [Verminephrobacter eiseniae]